ncbi:CatB-related O-acetyltransferase [Erythrobacter aurantius]|uniref:CatB-related O-acetyltransferase n=1 Tax=Erythrobacter aurantius TaxID=2909249 RepID=UPI0038B28589
MLRRIAGKIKRILKSDEFSSVKLRREIFAQYEIEVGLYSYGCFDPTRIGRKTRFGRYCSVSPTAYIFRRNHGLEFLGLTPYFYNELLGVVEEDKIPHEPLEIGDDVWLGHGSVILPSVKRIGRGAVIAAGAVVTKDVEPYGIVAGNPAKLIRKRFNDETIEKIERSGWWKMTPSDLKREIGIQPQLFFEPQIHLRDRQLAVFRS